MFFCATSGSGDPFGKKRDTIWDDVLLLPAALAPNTFFSSVMVFVEPSPYRILRVRFALHYKIIRIALNGVSPSTKILLKHFSSLTCHLVWPCRPLQVSSTCESMQWVQGRVRHDESQAVYRLSNGRAPKKVDTNFLANPNIEISFTIRYLILLTYIYFPTNVSSFTSYS